MVPRLPTAIQRLSLPPNVIFWSSTQPSISVAVDNSNDDDDDKINDNNNTTQANFGSCKQLPQKHQLHTLE
jgi:hypothetical protein